MTKRNLTWKNNGMSNPRDLKESEPTFDLKATTRPFLLKSEGKDYLWGGNRLRDDFGKDINMAPLAESWECSTHPDGPSRVASGEFEGQLLSEVLIAHPNFMGYHINSSGKLPILIKFIDAKSDLSVQVHPDDEYAKTHENGALGKTEMWYVIDASKDAQLVYGFSHEIDKDTLRKSLSEETLEKYLQKVSIKKDDVFYIEAGTVHAIGAGALIAEIQESSNITYRLYDYNRVAKNGKKRELHIDKALDVINLKSSAEPRQPMSVLKYKRGWATEFLCRSEYFQVERMLLNTENCREMAHYQTGSDTFQVLLCLEGCGDLFGEGTLINFFKGDCIFVPANSISLKLHGIAQLLRIKC